jgi:two-component system sensor histidine kinase DegS
VEKHAKAEQVRVSLTATDLHVLATIEDDGVGFDVEAVSQDPTKWLSFGLKGFVERAKLVGGTAKIESRKGRGTLVMVDIPAVKEAG